MQARLPTAATLPQAWPAALRSPARPGSRLRAVRVSRDVAMLLRHEAAGVVMSVHATATNVRLHSPAVRDGRLVAILDAEGGGIPGAILLGRQDAARLPGLHPGEWVRAVDGRLQFESGLTLLLGGATSWECHLGRLDIEHEGLARRLAAAHEAAAGLGPGGLGPGSAFAATAASARTELAAALRCGGAPHRLGQAAAAGNALVGLGPGLTPSGDDLLVGLTAALTAAGHDWARPLAAGWARLAPEATTPVAAAFHHHAAAGDYAERITMALQAILQGGPAGVPGALANLAAWGATSGRDTLAGILLGLDAVHGTEGLAS